MRFSRLTKILIGLVVVVVLGVLLGARSLKPDGTLDDLLAWLPKRHASFEQLGGSQLLLEIDKDDVVKSRLEAVLDDVVEGGRDVQPRLRHRRRLLFQDR